MQLDAQPDVPSLRVPPCTLDPGLILRLLAPMLPVICRWLLTRQRLRKLLLASSGYAACHGAGSQRSQIDTLVLPHPCRAA
jgi:hypothetical protein